MLLDLLPCSSQDLLKLIPWIRTPQELFTWSATTFAYPLDRAQLEAHYRQVQAADNQLMFKAVESDSHEQVGYLELIRINQETKTASIAYVIIDPERRGHGVGLALIKSALNVCFLVLELSKVDLFVFDFNTSAIKCYERAGFKLEQVLPDKIKRNDEFIPLNLMSLDYEKWRELKDQ